MAVVAIFAVTAAHTVYGQAHSFSPDRSLLVNVSLGAGFDLGEEARSPLNHAGENREAYSLGAFVIGIRVGYRFNEILAVEGGWLEQQHSAHQEWGNRAGYMFGTLALRLAWPLATRQTPVLKIGPLFGAFSYGSASYGETEDNSTFVCGGHLSAVLEHELVLGIVATLGVTYAPLYRTGMDGVLTLEEIDYGSNGTAESRVVGTKDFTEGRMVHLVWVTAGIQFEWAFR